MSTTLSLVQEAAKYLLDNKADCFHLPEFFTCNEISEHLFIHHQVKYGTTGNVLASIGALYIRKVLNPALAMGDYELMCMEHSAFISAYIDRVSDVNSDGGAQLHETIRTQWLEYIINYRSIEDDE